MPVEHMVWIKFKPGVDQARIDQHVRNLRALPAKVPGITRLVVGANFTDRAMGYTHGLLVSFPSRQELEAYLPHPEHMAVAAPLREDADTLAMDIEG